MTTQHVEPMLAELSVGAEYIPDLTLERWGISTSAVRAIPSCYVLWPEDSYCPVSNVRGSGVGIQFYDDGECEVRGGGWCLFCFKLSIACDDEWVNSMAMGEFGPVPGEDHPWWDPAGR